MTVRFMRKEVILTDVDTYLQRYHGSCLTALRRIPEARVRRLIELLGRAREQGRQIFICGNGGSAATASHFANDLGTGASYAREKRFRVLALTDNIARITALANDKDYSQIFVEQLKN